jgi:ASC-1-like (ASCH) protein
MESMTVMMKLRAAPFDAIKSGCKDIELRLYDEKRRQLQLGDIITFSKLPENDETMKVKVVGLLHYPTFADLVEDFIPERMGAKSKVGLIEGMMQYYSKEEQELYDVLGIKLELVS